MKVKVDDFLTPAQLGKATKDNPVYAFISDVNFIEAEDLPFTSKKGKYELTLKMNDEQIKWLANKTSLRSIINVFGIEAENWIGKRIELWVLDQVVQGDLKKVVYAGASADK